MAVTFKPITAGAKTFGDLLTVTGATWVQLWTGESPTMSDGSYVDTSMFNRFGNGWIEVGQLGVLQLDYAQANDRYLYVQTWTDGVLGSWTGNMTDFSVATQNFRTSEIDADTTLDQMFVLNNARGEAWVQIAAGVFENGVWTPYQGGDFGANGFLNSGSTFGNGWVQVKDLGNFAFPLAAAEAGNQLWINQWDSKADRSIGWEGWNVSVGEGPVAGPFYLTDGHDNIVGTSGDDVFIAPIVQASAGFGNVTNTLESGDMLNGMGGNNVLRADVIDTVVGMFPGGPAISPITSNIQEAYIRVQDVHGDPLRGSTIDAEKMSGVEAWWNDSSRAFLQIEDIRTRPNDTTFGMRSTDFNANYNAFFSPLYMFGDIDATSSLTFIIQEITGGQAPAATELANISVREINFSLDGVSYSLDTPAIRTSNTWADLRNAINDALSAEGLDTLDVVHLGNGVFVIDDSAGGQFSIVPGEAFIYGVTGVITVNNDMVVGRIVDEGPTETTVVLDGVGNGSQGGVLNIAAMSGEHGIEIFNVEVDRDSHLTQMLSINARPAGAFANEWQLEEVYLSHVAGGAEGTFQVGNRTVDAQGVSTTTDDRLQTNGLLDVRVFDASGFSSEIKVGAVLTNRVFDKYLLGVDEPVEFSYLLGDGGSNLSLAVNNAVAGDPDFELGIVGGAGNDRVNLAGLAVKQQTSVDGAGGENTLELTTSTGFASTANGFGIVAANAATDLTAAQTAFDNVGNINKLVLASQPDQNINVGNQANVVAAIAAANAAIGNGTNYHFVNGNLGEIPEVVIATGGNLFRVDYFDLGLGANNTIFINPWNNTTLRAFNANTQEAVISGKNQTLGAGNNDNNQIFGAITFTDTIGTEMDLRLDNTARVSGVMTVAALTYNATAGNANAVRTLNIDSDGVRNTSNVITTVNGNRVSTFNLEGSQDLRITNLASGANHAGAAAARDNLRVDASDLDGDLYLGVTGAVITAIDAALGTNRTVTLIGTNGDSDILNIRDGVTTTNATTIRGFETIRFGEGATIAVNTAFNATNVEGVELYDLLDSNAGITIDLTSLRATENVQINAGNNITGTEIQGDVTLAVANPTAGSRVNVNFTTNETTLGFVGNFWEAGGANLNVQDFQTIRLDMGGTANQSYNYNFDLNTLANPVTGLVNARTLEIVGGRVDAAGTLDSLTLGQLDTALTRVDFSEYTGNFTAAGWNSLGGSSADIVLNAYDFNFDIGSVVAQVISSAQAVDFAGASGAAGLVAGDTIQVIFGTETVITTLTAANIATDVDMINAVINTLNADAGWQAAGYNAFRNGSELVVVNNDGLAEANVAVTSATNVALNTVLIAAGAQNNAYAAVGDFIQLSNFITKFVVTSDADDAGVVWQIDNFQAFNADVIAGLNVTISNQSQLDLRAVGVDSATKINIEDGAAFMGGDAAAIDAIYGAGWAVANAVAGNTIITSNEGLDYTILLTGVDVLDLANENIVGIA